MIDSHCHIGFDMDTGELNTLVSRAHQQGVSHMLTVCCDFNHISDLSQAIKIPTVYGSFGIHPENASDFNEEKFLNIFQTLPELLAVGEIGLDYYYNNDTQEIQKQVFLKQIELAATLNKPIIIHTRDAEDDTLDILKTAHQNGWLKNSGVLHCYTGTIELAEQAIELGLYVSASGIITFKNSEKLRSVFTHLPIERLLIETDSPYLAPVPFRGKTNEPSFLPNTLEKLAEIKGLSINETEAITIQNFKNLFRITNES